MLHPVSVMSCYIWLLSANYIHLNHHQSVWTLRLTWTKIKSSDFARVTQGFYSPSFPLSAHLPPGLSAPSSSSDHVIMTWGVHCSKLLPWHCDDFQWLAQLRPNYDCNSICHHPGPLLHHHPVSLCHVSVWAIIRDDDIIQPINTRIIKLSTSYMCTKLQSCIILLSTKTLCH